MTVNIVINDKLLEAHEGQTVLEVARRHGIRIPTLCYHKDLTPVGSCRLCIVEVEKMRGHVTACTLPVSEGMIIHTESPALVEARKTILQMLLLNYHDAGYETNDPHANEFQHWLDVYKPEIPADFIPIPKFNVNSDPNPFVWVDFNKCILCTRCVRACAEVQGRFVWGVAERGADTHIIAGADSTMLEARCESCGACVAYCPTGALDNKMALGLGQPDKLVTTTCTYCGVGCQFDLNVKNNHVIRVTSNPEAPVNGMHLCVKGRYGYDFIHHPDRLTKPQVRKYLLDGKPRPVNRGPWVEVDWDTALTITAEKLAFIRDNHGADRIGVLTSAKCLNEENYLMNKFARQVIGTNSIDHCARLCHSSTVVGLAATLGSGAMTNSMDDVAHFANAILIIGSNITEQHPVFGAMIRQAVLKRKVKLIVADPRKIDITEFATLHLRHRSGTDVALINGLMNIIVQNSWQDSSYIDERTEGFDEFKAVIDDYPPEKVSNITGISLNQLYQAAEILALTKPMAVIWAMGITQHIVGVQNVMSLSNLQLLLGNLGVQGGGVNPLRGQNNVQGACDMGGLPNVYSGYQAVTLEASQQKFEKAWGVSLPTKAGLTVTEMIPAALDGTVLALYMMGEDPVMSDPDSNHIRKCLANCEFLVLQEIFPSQTAEYADILLPSVSFAEKTGTFTNTERRVQMVRKAIEPPGEAREDWWITTQLANRILAIGSRRINPLAIYGQWNYSNTDQIMREIAALTPSYAGISHERLEKGERLQWPVTSNEHPGTPILHVGKFARGRGKFMPIEHIPPAELPDDDYPIILSTGRVLYHWHGGEITRRAKGLLDIYPHPFVEINPEDGEKLGLDGKTRVRISSRRGSIVAEAWVTDRVPPGVVFANFHFPEASANELTISALDPVAKIPEYKVCAVRIEAV
jgi:formate dehydrogenase alpha subunit